MAPGLCATFSLILFIAFEIWQLDIANRLSIQFARAVNKTDADVPAALQTYKQESQRLSKAFLAANQIIFRMCAVTGVAGGGILIYAFVAGLFRM